MCQNICKSCGAPVDAEGHYQHTESIETDTIGVSTSNKKQMYEVSITFRYAIFALFAIPFFYTLFGRVLALFEISDPLFAFLQVTVFVFSGIWGGIEISQGSKLLGYTAYFNAITAFYYLINVFY